MLLACYFWLKFEPITRISKIRTATSAILPSIKFRSWTESEKPSQFNPDTDAQCPLCVTNIFKIHSPQSLNYITSNYRLKKMQSVWINEVIYCSHNLCHIQCSSEWQAEIRNHQNKTVPFLWIHAYRRIQICRSKENQWVTWLKNNPLTNEVVLEAPPQDVLLL